MRKIFLFLCLPLCLSLFSCSQPDCSDPGIWRYSPKVTLAFGENSGAGLEEYLNQVETDRRIDIYFIFNVALLDQEISASDAELKSFIEAVKEEAAEQPDPLHPGNPERCIFGKKCIEQLQLSGFTNECSAATSVGKFSYELLQHCIAAADSPLVSCLNIGYFSEARNS